MHVVLLAALAGIGMGMLSGLVGIGGGVILVPILLYLFKTDMHVAAGTSLAVIIPTAVAGVISHFSAGNVNLRLGLAIAPGAIVGALLGAYLANILPALTLKRVFAVIIFLMSLKILWDSFGVGAKLQTRAPQGAATEVAVAEERLD